MIVLNETYMRYLQYMIAEGPIGYCPMLGERAVLQMVYETIWSPSRGCGFIICQN